MEILEEIFNNKYKEVFAKGKEDFFSKLESGRDKLFVYREYKDSFDRVFVKMQSEFAPFTYQTLREIEFAIKRDKNISTEDAIQLVLKDVPEETKEDAVIKISTIKATGDLSNFFYDYYSKNLRMDSESENVNKSENDNEIYQSKIQWKGNNKTEFVQFVYALYEAKLITNEENEVTTLVDQLAQMLNYDLGKNWQSYKSKSIRVRNSDYEPEIFKKLHQAFKAYSERLRNKE